MNILFNWASLRQSNFEGKGHMIFPHKWFSWDVPPLMRWAPHLMYILLFHMLTEHAIWCMWTACIVLYISTIYGKKLKQSKQSIMARVVGCNIFCLILSFGFVCSVCVDGSTERRCGFKSYQLKSFELWHAEGVCSVKPFKYSQPFS